MRLKKFQVQDFKSMKTFDPCWLANDITILAGKNESGKTAALEALSDFDFEKDQIREEAMPLENEDVSPKIQLWFEITDEEWADLFEDIGFTLDKECKEYCQKHGIPIIKTSDGEYSFGPEFFDLLEKSTKAEKQQTIKRIKVSAERLSSEDSRFSELPVVSKETNFKDFIAALDRIIALASKPNKKPEDPQNPQSEANNPEPFSDHAKETIDKLKEEAGFLINTTDYNAILESLFEYLPAFVFFDSFEHELPFSVPLEDVEKHPAVMDFIKVSQIDIDRVRNANDEQRRMNLLSGKSAEISGDFSGYWKQDTVKLSASVSGSTFIISILEDGKTTAYKPEQRSKGFQWFLSFYLRLKAHNILGQEKNSIILIDEPGLYLHAKAQKDVLSVLESLAEDGAQILFSTHSPYLLDTDRFDRIRLVTKDFKRKNEGSIVHNKIHAQADRDTLTPIITALGFNIAMDDALIRKRNVLLEGMSDYYFLHAMAEYIGKVDTLKNLSLIPGKGATQIHLLASILFGWGLDFIAVLDNDKQGKSVKKELTEEMDIDVSKVLLVSEKTDANTEDLFSTSDFINHVLSDDIRKSLPSEENKANSKIIKNDSDKVLVAKLFMDKVRKKGKGIKLSEETINNFIELFKRMQIAFDGEKIEKQTEQKTTNQA
ncbi:MAG: AAA family ATPase [Rhodospirillales bacterium]|nr:AAA family ATPase [Rhodospirillales bacterium]